MKNYLLSAALFVAALPFANGQESLASATCPNPVGFDVQRISDTSATLSVDTSEDPANLYDVYISPNGENPAPTNGSSYTPGQVANNDITLPDTRNTLAANSTYDVWIRKDCGGGDVSDWVGPVHVPLFCSIPTPTINRIDATTIEISTDVPVWDMIVNIFPSLPNGNTTNPQSNNNDKTGTVTRSNLNPSRTYYLWFRQQCTATQTSDYSMMYTVAPMSMTMKPAASPNPTNGLVKIENFEAVSAQVVGLATGKAELNTKVVNNEINISNLPAGQYIIQVKDAKGNVESLQVIKK